MYGLLINPLFIHTFVPVEADLLTQVKVHHVVQVVVDVSVVVGSVTVMVVEGGVEEETGEVEEVESHYV